MEARLKLNKWVDTPSDPKFAEKLLSLIPELKEHTCSKGYPGGFVERLEEGTYPAHIIEHIALAIQEKVGPKVSFGKTRRENDDIYKVVMEYEYKKIAEISLEAGIYILNSLYKNELDQEKFDEYIDNAEKYIEK